MEIQKQGAAYRAATSRHRLVYQGWWAHLIMN